MSVDRFIAWNRDNGCQSMSILRLEVAAGAATVNLVSLIQVSQCPETKCQKRTSYRGHAEGDGLAVRHPLAREPSLLKQKHFTAKIRGCLQGPREQGSTTKGALFSAAAQRASVPQDCILYQTLPKGRCRSLFCSLYCSISSCCSCAWSFIFEAGPLAGHRHLVQPYLQAMNWMVFCTWRGMLSASFPQVN